MNIKGYDAWKLASPYDDDPDEDEYYEATLRLIENMEADDILGIPGVQDWFESTRNDEILEEIRNYKEQMKYSGL